MFEAAETMLAIIGAGNLLVLAWFMTRVALARPVVPVRYKPRREW
jgi:hypothetical protein